MNTEKEKLSKEAQELIKLCPVEGSIDVASVLANRPDLMTGLNEYVEFARSTGEEIAESKSIPKMGHKMSNTAKKLAKKQQKKK